MNGRAEAGIDSATLTSCEIDGRAKGPVRLSGEQRACLTAASSSATSSRPVSCVVSPEDRQRLWRAPLGGTPPSHPAAPNAMRPRRAIPIDRRARHDGSPWPERDGRSPRIRISTMRSITCTPASSKPGSQNRLTRSCRSGNRCFWLQEREPGSESSCEWDATG